MEQARYWMWMKKKHVLKSHFRAPMNSGNDSWEEQAFAEDAAGPLGGCIWPPKSYSCSFCRREFRSAQALGGHMNIHRRDRARLKQSPSPHSEVLHHHHQTRQPVNPCKPSFVQDQSHICTLDCNPDPNTSPSSLDASPLSPSRVSTSSSQENFSEHTYVRPNYSSSVVHEYYKGTLFSAPPSWSDSVAVRNLSTAADSRRELRKNQKKEEFIFWGNDECVETDLSIGLNSDICRSRPTGSGSNKGIISKKPKSAVSPLPLFFKPCLNDRYHLQSEAMEDLDLELRLGDPPKVK